MLICAFTLSCGQDSEGIVEVQETSEASIADTRSFGEEDATVELPDNSILVDAEAAKKRAEEEAALAAKSQAEAEAARERAEEEAALATMSQADAEAARERAEDEAVLATMGQAEAEAARERAEEEAALAAKSQAEAEAAKERAEEEAALAAMSQEEAEAAKERAEEEAALAAMGQEKAELTLAALEAAIADPTKYVFNGKIYNKRALDDTNDCDSSIECSGNELCLDSAGTEENAPSGDRLFPHNGDPNRPMVSLPGAVEECREPA